MIHSFIRSFNRSIHSCIPLRQLIQPVVQSKGFPIGPNANSHCSFLFPKPLPTAGHYWYRVLPGTPNNQKQMNGCFPVVKNPYVTKNCLGKPPCLVLFRVPAGHGHPGWPDFSPPQNQKLVGKSAKKPVSNLLRHESYPTPQNALVLRTFQVDNVAIVTENDASN